MGQLLAEMGLREHMEVELAAVVWAGDAQRQRALPRHAVARPHRLAADLAAGSAGCDERTLAAQVRSERRLRRTDSVQQHQAARRLQRATSARGLRSGFGNRRPLGSAKVANVVMLGALLEETECLPAESAIAVLEATVKNPKLLELDRQAIAAGRDYVDTKIEVGAVSQPDGYSY